VFRAGQGDRKRLGRHALKHEQLVEALLPVIDLIVHQIEKLFLGDAHGLCHVGDLEIRLDIDDWVALGVLPEAFAPGADDLLQRHQVVVTGLKEGPVVHGGIFRPDDHAIRMHLELAWLLCVGVADR